MNKKQIIKELMYQLIEQHGVELNKVFNTKYNNIELSKKLFSLEYKFNFNSIRYANGDISDEQYYKNELPLVIKLKKILGKNADLVFINYDPRGYSLKITPTKLSETFKKYTTLHRDLGGYYILAPDFRDTAIREYQYLKRR